LEGSRRVARRTFSIEAATTCAWHFTLLRDARPVLLNLDEPGGFEIAPWAGRVQLVDAYVAWVRKLTQRGLAEVLTTWFGPPAVT